MKIFKNIVIVTGAITVALSVFYLFTLSKMEFNFANEGKILCITTKDWGFMSKGEVNCFNFSPVNEEKDEQRFNCKTINGEIVVSTK